MKRLVPILLALVVSTPAALHAAENESKEACESDPVKDEEAVATARRADLARAFVTVTTETVDDALKRTDAYWDSRESGVFERISDRIRGITEAAHNRAPAEWIEACHKSAEAFRFACASLSSPALVDLCLVASAGETLERCAYAKPSLEPACRLARGGGSSACESAQGEGLALCERVKTLIAQSSRVCSAEAFDEEACFVARVLDGFGRGEGACAALGSGVEPLAAQLIERACRAVVQGEPDRCPNPTDNYRQSASVEVLVRARSGVPWIVVVGGSTGSAMCAVEVELADQDILHSRRILLDLSKESRHVDTEAQGYRGALAAKRVRLGGIANPLSGEVRARSVCAPVPTWQGALER